jgi:putative transposase
MPESKQDISNSAIEKEIYNTFAQFKDNKNVKIADYLNRLNVAPYCEHKYRKIKFPYESLFKLILFQRLKGIKFHTKLTKYLRRNPAEKFKLGFSETPDRTSIGYFINHVLDEETNRLIDFIVTKIEEISEKFGILLDVKTLRPEASQKDTKERNLRLQKHEETKNVCRLFKRRIAPFINFHQAHNVVYQKQELINLLVHLGLSQDFAENGSRIFREQPKAPSGKTLLYHLKKYSDIKELQAMYLAVFEVVWEMARQANLFDIRKRYDVAIDYTEWFYYESKNTMMIVGKQPERGTSTCYKFATINIVESGKRFTLLALPVTLLEGRDSILSKLFSYALQRIKINHVYIDRGFFDSLSLSTVEKFHLKYLMPAIHNFSVKRVMDLSPTPSVVKGFTLNNLPMNLVIVDGIDKKGEKVKRVFATNIDFDEKEVGLAERLLVLYSKRWGIETSYRVKKHSYRPKTTSKNYIIRLFYFLFSVLLYNMWRFCAKVM